MAPYLLIIAFSLYGIGLCFASWERKELRDDLSEEKKLFWKDSLDKYGPGVSIKSPPYAYLTERGKFYAKAKYIFFTLGFVCFLLLIYQANM